MLSLMCCFRSPFPFFPLHRRGQKHLRDFSFSSLFCFFVSSSRTLRGFPRSSPSDFSSCCPVVLSRPQSFSFFFALSPILFRAPPSRWRFVYNGKSANVRTSWRPSCSLLSFFSFFSSSVLQVETHARNYSLAESLPPDVLQRSKNTHEGTASRVESLSK